jgi:hypothetical protein
MYCRIHFAPNFIQTILKISALCTKTPTTGKCGERMLSKIGRSRLLSAEDRIRRLLPDEQIVFVKRAVNLMGDTTRKMYRIND